MSTYAGREGVLEREQVPIGGRANGRNLGFLLRTHFMNGPL